VGVFIRETNQGTAGRKAERAKVEQRTTLTELRDALGAAKEGLDQSRELAEQAERNLENARAAFEIADRLHHDRLLWAAHSRTALPGLKKSRAALADSRGELERRRKPSALACGLVAEGEGLVAMLERAIDDRLNELERNVLCGPELVLDIWN
jgi:hypothetical protein